MKIHLVKLVPPAPNVVHQDLVGGQLKFNRCPDHVDDGNKQDGDDVDYDVDDYDDDKFNQCLYVKIDRLNTWCSQSFSVSVRFSARGSPVIT